MLRTLIAVAVITSVPLALWAAEGALGDPPQPTSIETPMAADTVPPQTPTIEGQLPEAKYPLLRLTPDKIEIVRLEEDATNVIVGNSKHLLSVLETPRMILLIPRQPGATHFQALNAKGTPIMERSVIVASPKQDYVRVRRACATKDQGQCKEFSVFFCPDMCHEIAVTQDAKEGAGITVPEETAGAGTEGAATAGGTTEETTTETTGE